MNQTQVEEVRISDFDYPLPDGRIARHPLAERDRCRLLLSRPDGVLADRSFRELAALLPPCTSLFCNDTRVINARMAFFKPSGARIEVFLLEPVAPADYALVFQSKGECSWACMVGNLKRWKESPLAMSIPLDGRTVTLTATRGEALDGGAHRITFSWDDSSACFADIVDAAGKIPIPPYLNRDTEDSDTDDYQTVYSRIKGSVAAPTAGLHFTPAVIDDLAAHNIPLLPLTLHVGAGTFQPVKSETIGDHPMHTETFTVTRQAVEHLLRCVEQRTPVAAVGTTTVRTLESLPVLGKMMASDPEVRHVGQWDAYRSGDFCTADALRTLLGVMGERLTASTAIMIAPGFRWRLTDVMVTNFHQPQSTLLLLVSSFLSRYHDDPSAWRGIYDHALGAGYRFLSYGDACLLFPRRP